MPDAGTPDLENLRFPTGRYRPPPTPLDPDTRARMIDRIAAVPARLREALAGLDDARLDTPYRPDGWTLRQVVHHLPDSHLNSYVRFKLAMTEDHPTIRTYEEGRWGDLADAREAPIEPSLALLDALHERWTAWLRTLGDDDWRRTLHHPEIGDIDLDQLLALYAWHGPHHVAHVTGLRERMGW